MRHIYLYNPKGGCGKTTLATQIAGHYAVAGRAVAIVDHDPQRSALDWHKLRPEGCRPVTAVAAFKGESVAPSTEIAVHDLPGGASIEALRAQTVAGGHLMIPLLPSPIDIVAGVRCLMALGAEDWVGERLGVGLVANRVRANTRYYRVLMGFLASVNRPLVGTLRDTQNYIRCMDSGVTVFDLPPGRMRRELEQWLPIIAWLEGREMASA